MNKKCLYAVAAFLTVFTIVRFTSHFGVGVKMTQIKLEKRASNLAALAE